MTGGHGRDRPDHGFMLLEAAVAMALILVVMGAVTSFFLASVKVARQQRNAEVAAQIATSGMSTVHSMRGSTLINGRDSASSQTQWSALTPAVTAYLGSSVEAWDSVAAAGSGPTAALPTTPQDTIVRGLTYHTSWYIGSCRQPTAGGPCDQTAAAGFVPMYRVVVAVTWSDAACENSTCTYADAALVSSAPTDPVFNTGGTTAPATGGPYGGTAAAIPGTVQAENYDTGGQGVGYSVNSVNGGGGYRTESANLEATGDTGGGFDLGWTGGGQWQRYTVNVAAAGTYSVAFRIAAPSVVTGAFHLENLTGTNLSGNVNVPASGGWQTWTTVTANVALPAGQQTLTLAQDKGGWNINYFTFT
jgi:type II secretory pathway pseudopilin PulG